MKVRQYKDILLECLVTLRHARTFVTSREKMHQTGIELYDTLIVEIADALNAPEPACACKASPQIPDADCAACSPQETRSEPACQFSNDPTPWCAACGATYDKCGVDRAAANR